MPKGSIQVLIPMSGQGLRYKKAGYDQLKPFIPVNGTMMIERLVEKIPLDWPITFVMAENHRELDPESILKGIRPDCQVVFTPQNTQGPLPAILTGCETLRVDDPILVLYCDFGMKWDPWDFRDYVFRTEADACLLSYRGFHAHYNQPQEYAYSRLENGRVVEVREKGSFTENRENEFASSGGYYFKSTAFLIEACRYQVENNIKKNGEFYTSLTVEAALRLRPESVCTVYEIEKFYQWGTPQDLEDYEYWERTFSAFGKLKKRKAQFTSTTILMPMAGAGTRIRDKLGVPKPFLKIDGLPMYLQALSSFPKAKKNVFVVLDSMKGKIRLSPDDEIVSLQTTPSGQALSTEAGLQALSKDQDCIVTACDHSVVLCTEKWEAFLSNPNCDAAIFTIRNFPGQRRTPEAYSYVVSEPRQESFPKVSNVYVKSPPDGESSLLVGSFWFRDPKVAILGIDIIKKNRLYVNGEFYLDTIFQELISIGMTVREIPLDGYINWGDVSSLREALYWYENFMGYQLSVRKRYPGVLESDHEEV